MAICWIMFSKRSDCALIDGSRHFWQRLSTSRRTMRAKKVADGRLSIRSARSSALSPYRSIRSSAALAASARSLGRSKRSRSLSAIDAAAARIRSSLFLSSEVIFRTNALVRVACVVVSSPFVTQLVGITGCDLGKAWLNHKRLLWPGYTRGGYK